MQALQPKTQIQGPTDILLALSTTRHTAISSSSAVGLKFGKAIATHWPSAITTAMIIHVTTGVVTEISIVQRKLPKSNPKVKIDPKNPIAVPRTRVGKLSPQ